MRKEWIEELIQKLLNEQKTNQKEGIYAWMQIEAAYQSNKIEGNTLTRKQVASIFTRGEIIPDDNTIRLIDIEETTGHFVMFDEMLKTLNNSVSNNLLKKYHLCFRNSSSQDVRKGSYAGEYHKQKEQEEHECQRVTQRMDDLINTYNERDTHSLESLARFHAAYEEIMPFQGGNSRIGRLLLIKECLRSKQIPFIVHAANQATYKDALRKAQDEQLDELMDFFKKEQINFEREIEKIISKEK
ncbi:Fic family protein [Faecalicoccus pleomorphus]|uniref:Fic family protein n=1 Tax=Faecalicoccus pleomorphus TaxID=1323 RepID=UPI0019603409|nr:Fic family protein [Faecalicoccus pleomorphus]MBM6766154.1 Fic family protein [Faecalicoccus pleomorphus]